MLQYLVLAGFAAVIGWVVYLLIKITYVLRQNAEAGPDEWVWQDDEIIDYLNKLTEEEDYEEE